MQQSMTSTDDHEHERGERHRRMAHEALTGTGFHAVVPDATRAPLDERALWEALEAGSTETVFDRMLRQFDAGVEPTPVAPMPDALTEDLRERTPVDGLVISVELARYLARTLDAAATFAAKMPLYVQRADVGAWATDVRVSSTEAAHRLRTAALATEFPSEAAEEATAVLEGTAA